MKREKMIFLKNGKPELVDIDNSFNSTGLEEIMGTDDFEYLTLEINPDGTGYYAIIDGIGRIKGLEQECFINYGEGYTDLCGPVLIGKLDEYAEEEGRTPNSSFLDEVEMFKTLEYLEWEPFR